MEIITLEDDRDTVANTSYVNPAGGPRRPCRIPRARILQFNIPVTNNINAGNTSTSSYSPQNSPVSVTDASRLEYSRRSGVSYPHHQQQQPAIARTPDPVVSAPQPQVHPPVPFDVQPTPLRGSDTDQLAPLRPVERRIEYPAFL